MKRVLLSASVVLLPFLPYAQEVSKKDTLKQKEKSIEGVVITALGIGKKAKKIGYSTQEINTKQFETVTTPSVGNLFAGQVAGLNVSNPPGMQQKPTFTLRGNSNVIIVIDGVIVDDKTFQALDPSNIENINVLKGATASALYGSRGRYGAILVTTKSAKKTGFTVEFGQNTMFTAGFTNLPKTQTEYGNGSHGKYEFWDGADGGINDGDMIWGPKFVPGRKLAQWNSPILDKQTGQVIPWYGNVANTPYNDKSRYERVPTEWTYHDNLNTFLTPSFINNTNFAVNYKHNKDTYRLSGNFMNFDDGIPESYLRKYGANFSSNTYITDKLSFNTKLAYNRTTTPSMPNYNYDPSGHMYTILIWMGGDVDGRDLKNNLWVKGREGYQQANWNYAWYNNPWFGAKNFKNSVATDVYSAQTGLTYEASDEFTVKGKISYVENDTKNELKSPYSYFNYDAPRNGRYRVTNSKTINLNYDFLATYNKAITDNINLTVNAGGSGFYYKYKDDITSVDGLKVPGVYSFDNSIKPLTRDYNISEKLIYSAYGTVDLEFYKTLFVNVSGRNDWSSTLPKSNRSYFYPSASFSLLLNNIIPMPKAFDMVKLYGSWAQIAYDFDPYAIRNYYLNNGGNTFNGNPYYNYPSVLNKEGNIGPEKTRSYEAGLNIGMLNNRISLDVAYYNTLDYNNILRFPGSQTSGFATEVVNGNKYTTNGVDISLSLVPIKNSNFQWKSLLNWSKSVQKITEIYQGRDNYNNIKLNERTDSFYGYTWKKNTNGALILDANTGLPTRADAPSYLGHFNPDWTFGFTNTFKYKNLSLTVGIDGSFGGVMESVVVEKMWWGGKHPNSVQYRDAEYDQGKYTFVPNGVNYNPTTNTYTPHTKAISFQDWAQNYPYRAMVTESESKEYANVFDRSFIKLRSVVLEYDFTSILNPKGFVKGLTVNLSGYNLAMWKKSKNLYSDPDYKIGGTGIGSGRNTNSSNDIQDPSSRWFGVGFNLKF